MYPLIKIGRQFDEWALSVRKNSFSERNLISQILFFRVWKFTIPIARKLKYFARGVSHWSQSWQFSGIGRTHTRDLRIEHDLGTYEAWRPPTISWIIERML